MSRLVFVNAEVFLAYAANGANPIFGNVFESGAGSNAGIGITFSGIVNITTGVTDVLFHCRVT